jgi:hypothetical protein
MEMASVALGPISGNHGGADFWAHIKAAGAPPLGMVDKYEFEQRIPIGLTGGPDGGRLMGPDP